MEINESTPSEKSSSDNGATSSPSVAPDLLSKISAASDRAVNSIPAQKRRPGQRGPDKAPRRKAVPVDCLDNGTGPSLFEEGEGAGNPAFGLDAPGLDDETATALADVVFELFKDGRANLFRMKVLQITGNKELADAFITPISEKLETAMRKSAKLCVLKYGANIEYAPEITFLGAAAIIVVGDFMRLRMLKADAEKFRNSAA